MALEVFRRHQKKFLAVLAVLAMIAFTFNLGQFGGDRRGAGRNPVVFTIGGNPVRSADLNDLRVRRLRANQFIQQLVGVPNYFGDIDDTAMRDAYVLQQEAERLGMPATAEIGNKWLADTFPDLTADIFDRIYRENFSEGDLRCTDSDLLVAIADQLRLRALIVLPEGIDPLSRQMSRTPGEYLLTPLDLYNAYRDESERVSVNIIPISVDAFIPQTPEPTASDIEAYYNKYKDQLPDPARDTPGFKAPRRAQIEYLMIDADALEDKYRAELTDDEAKKYYLEHKSEFPIPPRPPGDLPVNVFAGDPDAKLTPRGTDDFTEVRETVRNAIARKKAADEVDRLFGLVRTEVMEPFQARHDAASEAARDAREAGQTPAPLPVPKNEQSGNTLVKEKADALGINYDVTALITREDADKLVPIGSAKVGSDRVGGRRGFAEHFFDTTSRPYEQIDLADAGGMRYLAWKLDDQEAHVPPLDEIRPQVVDAWKREQARALDLAEANKLAEEARKAGGDLKSVAGSRLLLTTTEVTKLVVPTVAYDQPVRESDIPEIPYPGKALRDAIFSLEPGKVAVEPNASKSTYYVLTLNKRAAPDLKLLFGPFGARQLVEQRVGIDTLRERQRRWLDYLRSKAGVVVTSETPTG